MVRQTKRMYFRSRGLGSKNEMAQPDIEGLGSNVWKLDFKAVSWSRERMIGLFKISLNCTLADFELEDSLMDDSDEFILPMIQLR